MLIADSLGTNFDREIKQEDLASLLTYFIIKAGNDSLGKWHSETVMIDKIF